MDWLDGYDPDDEKWNSPPSGGDHALPVAVSAVATDDQLPPAGRHRRIDDDGSDVADASGRHRLDATGEDTDVRPVIAGVVGSSGGTGGDVDDDDYANRVWSVRIGWDDLFTDNTDDTNDHDGSGDDDADPPLVEPPQPGDVTKLLIGNTLMFVLLVVFLYTMLNPPPPPDINMGNTYLNDKPATAGWPEPAVGRYAPSGVVVPPEIPTQVDTSLSPFTDVATPPPPETGTTAITTATTAATAPAPATASAR